MTTPVYTPHSTVKLTVAFPQPSGAPLIPSTVTRTVMDEAGVVLSPAEAVTVPPEATNSIEIEIPAALNDLQGAQVRGARQVLVKFTTAAGEFEHVEVYLIEKSIILTRMQNSFVTYPEALMVRRDLVTLDGWDSASQADRVAALTFAHSNLCQMTYRFREGANQSRLGWEPGNPFGLWTYVYDIQLADEAEWNQYTREFKTALQRAQLAEADVLLKGDPVGEKRRAGIISETIGESSMFFRQVPEVRLAVSREALTHLKGYVFRESRIARA